MKVETLQRAAKLWYNNKSLSQYYAFNFIQQMFLYRKLATGTEVLTNAKMFSKFSRVQTQLNKVKFPADNNPDTNLAGEFDCRQEG